MTVKCLLYEELVETVNEQPEFMKALEKMRSEGEDI